MAAGLIIRVTEGTFIQHTVTFDYQFFFNLLLPPIILASGYELHQANFFRHIGTILTFAFAGTFISAVVMGLFLWLWTRLPLDGFRISFVEAISVGATLSATDPVTILAIFNTYKVDPKLYTIIFGEAILNDAVAIVIFDTAQRYSPGKVRGNNLTITSLFEAFGIFLLIFFGSLLIGVIIGVGTALLLKLTLVRRYPKIESCLVILIAYASYFFANGALMSGEKFINSSTEVVLLIHSRRYCQPLILRYNFETLCLLQHVQTDTADNQIRLRRPGSAIREFYLHLSRLDALHRKFRFQACIHHNRRCGNMLSKMVLCLPTFKDCQRYSAISRRARWTRASSR